jgi:predicted metal-dependent hydrolase
LSAIGITAFFEEFDEYFVGADPEPVDLWKWHLAEEHEHRTVAHEVYHALFGKNKLAAYIYRVWAFVYAVRHIRSHQERVTERLLKKDRRGMTPEQVAASKARVAKVRKTMNRRAWEHLRDIFSPFYDPAKRRAPRGVAAYLQKYASQSAA